jgi:hypothetical protein
VFHPQFCSLQIASPTATAPPRHSVRNRSVPPSGRRTIPCQLYKEMGVRLSSAASPAGTPAHHAGTPRAKCLHLSPLLSPLPRLRCVDPSKDSCVDPTPRTRPSSTAAARSLAHGRDSTARDGARACPGPCLPCLHASTLISLHLSMVV